MTTETKVTPSPIPWEFVMSVSGKGAIVSAQNDGKSISSGRIVPVGKNPQARADAEFIVLAVNAYAQMLEALENLENDDNSIPGHEWVLVQSAIAKAKGGAA